MKKIIGILVTLAMLLLLTSACGADMLPEKDTDTHQEENQTRQETEPEQTPQETEPEQTQPQETEPEGILAPDFTVYDAEGNEVHLSDFIGKPVVLNFWATWCGPCKSELPDFNEKYLEHGENVQFLMVDLTDGRQETVEGASAFVAQQGYTFPVFFDTESEAVMAYGINAIPTTFFINAEGYAVGQVVGMIDAQTLQEGIDMILPE